MNFDELGRAIDQLIGQRAAALALSGLSSSTLNIDSLQSCVKQATKEVSMMLRAYADALDPPEKATSNS